MPIYLKQDIQILLVQQYKVLAVISRGGLSIAFVTEALIMKIQAAG